MLHLQVTPLLFTTIKYETHTVENVAYAWHDEIDDAHVYKMKCN